MIELSAGFAACAGVPSDVLTPAAADCSGTVGHGGTTPLVDPVAGKLCPSATMGAHCNGNTTHPNAKRQ